MKTAWRSICRGTDRIATAVIVGLVVAYKHTLSPLLGRQCRFEPTCSIYLRQAVEKHGAWRGCLRGIRRICRCHPWSAGGYDPP